jgi:hypothetical protein
MPGLPLTVWLVYRVCVCVCVLCQTNCERSACLSHLDLNTFIDPSSDPEAEPRYSHFPAIRKHETSKTQQKLDALFNQNLCRLHLAPPQQMASVSRQDRQ